MCTSELTECVLDAGVEGTSGALVGWVVLKEEVDFARLGIGHHVQFQIIPHVGVRPVYEGDKT
jgi:hypothetical protein